MAEIRPTGRSAMPAAHVLGRKLDSIPFSRYHLMIILVLSLVGFVDGYDLVMTGSLLVLAKQPLHMAPDEIRFLAIASTMMIVVGGFIASAISDHFSRKAIMLIGTAGITFFTLLIPLVQTGEQLIMLRLLTGLAGGFAVSAPFPIASELMPAQHRRTYGAIYEMSLAAAFTVLPLVGGLLAGNSNAFRWMALPGGLAFLVVPAMIYLLIPESPRWYLRRGHPEAAVDTVNRIVRRAGNRVPELSVAALGRNLQTAREPLPPYRALWARGQLPWTLVGISSYVFAGTGFFLISVLLPKGPGRSGQCRRDELRRRHLGIHGKHSGQRLHRLANGDHRPSLDDLLCACRLTARAVSDDAGTPRRIFGDDSDDHRSGDDRLHRAVGRHRLPDLFIGAVSDRATRPRAHLRRISRPDILRGASAVPDGTACRLGDESSLVRSSSSSRSGPSSRCCLAGKLWASSKQ
jgi:MFS family permease